MLSASPLSLSLLKQPLFEDADQKVPGTPEFSSPKCSLQSARGLSPGVQIHGNARRTPSSRIYNSSVRANFRNTPSPLIREVLTANTTSSILEFLDGRGTATSGEESEGNLTELEDEDEYTTSTAGLTRRKLNQNMSSSLYRATVSTVPSLAQELRTESIKKRVRRDSDSVAKVPVANVLQINRTLPENKSLQAKSLDLFGANAEIFARKEE